MTAREPAKGVTTPGESCVTDADRVAAIIDQAEAYHGDVALRCIEARGAVTDYVSVAEVTPDTWVMMREESCEGRTDGVMVETPHVRNTAMLCLPDVHLVDIDDSLFRGDDA